MSASTSNSAIVTEYETDLLYNRVVTAAAAFTCYELLITFRYEYEFLWRRKWTASTWLFIINRYAILTSVIVQISPVSAQMPSIFCGFLREFPHKSSDNHNGRVLGIEGLCIAGPRLYDCWISILVRYGPDGRYMVVRSEQASNTIKELMCWAVNLASLLTTIAADVIAVGTILFKSYHHVRQAASVGVNASIGTTLLQYGILYFIVICVVNVADLLVSVVPAFRSTNVIDVFIDVLPSIVISRFLINLRQANSAAPSDMTRFSHFSAPNFHVPTLPEIIGNLGEPLANSDEALDDEELEEKSELCEVSSNKLLEFEEDQGIFCVPHTDGRLNSGVEEVRMAYAPPRRSLF
ncbi:hypothetical protein NM688_g5644 [Phlebia brevispora]|uniref:Uncharacterized protein n=1 Tax=Phlebia brevispora TaxID=194682 RepID=A0ACC1SS97_9APHY|nr:hypothetical protein NM688_g5644 [Phlebia brevispora]